MMRLFLAFVVLVGWSSHASAEVQVLYCMADYDENSVLTQRSLVLGRIYDQQQPLEQELRNAYNSAGYAECRGQRVKVVTLAAIPLGHEVLIDADGTATTRERADVTNRKALEASIRTKLKAGDPLTDEEIDLWMNR